MATCFLMRCIELKSHRNQDMFGPGGLVSSKVTLELVIPPPRSSSRFGAFADARNTNHRRKSPPRRLLAGLVTFFFMLPRRRGQTRVHTIGLY